MVFPRELMTCAVVFQLCHLVLGDMLLAQNLLEVTLSAHAQFTLPSKSYTVCLLFVFLLFSSVFCLCQLYLFIFHLVQHTEKTSKM